MNLYDKIINREAKISLVGLGYVGMPIAVAFAKKANVIGFDISQEKVDLYKKGIDPTKEVGDEVIKQTTVEFTADENKLKEAITNPVIEISTLKDEETANKIKEQI